MTIPSFTTNEQSYIAPPKQSFRILAATTYNFCRFFDLA